MGVYGLGGIGGLDARNAPGVRNVVRQEREWGERLRLVRVGPDVGMCMAETGEGWEMRGEGLLCERPWGAGTWHAGAGRCARHGGNTRAGGAEGVWLMMHAFAKVEEVTPWEALLREVSRTHSAVEWLQRKVGEAPDDDALLAGGSHGEWVRMWQQERAHGVRVFKATMDIGVERILLEQNRIDGERMARVLSAGMEAAGMTEDQRTRAGMAMRAALEAHSASNGARGELG